MGDRLTFAISWPGVEAATGVRYSNSHGTTPGRALLRCNPQDNIAAIEEFGDLYFRDSLDHEITIPDCRVVDMLQVPQGMRGWEWEITIEDRRWRWQNMGDVQGWYNQLDPHGKLIPWTIRSPLELTNLALLALGESIYDPIIDMPAGLARAVGMAQNSFLQNGVNFPPSGTNPSIDWPTEQPVVALQRLCESFGRKISYNPVSNQVVISQAGIGATLPIVGKSVASVSPGLKSPKMPDGIKVIGAPNRYPLRAKLEPVGLDWDESIKPINLLSYTPNITQGAVQITKCPLVIRNTIGKTGGLAVRIRDRDFTFTVDGVTNYTAQQALASLRSDINAANIRVTASIGTHEETDDPCLVLTGTEAGDTFMVTTRIFGTMRDALCAWTNWNSNTQEAVSPTRNWTHSMPPDFANVRATDRLTYEQAVALAKKSVWKYYRIKNEDVDGGLTSGSAASALTVPGFGRIDRLQQVYLLPTKVDQIVPSTAEQNVTSASTLNGEHILNFYNGYSKDQPAVVYGAVSLDVHKTLTWSNIDSTGNSHFRSKVYVPIAAVDPIYQLIIFEDHVYKFAGDESAGGTRTVSEISRCVLIDTTEFGPATSTYVEIVVAGVTVSVTDATSALAAVTTLASLINAEPTLLNRCTARPVAPSHPGARCYVEVIGSTPTPLNFSVDNSTANVRHDLIRAGNVVTNPYLPSTSDDFTETGAPARPDRPNNNLGPVAAPQLVLETSCHIRDNNTNAFMRFELRRDLGQKKGTADAVWRKDDVKLEITAEWSILQEGVHLLSNHQLLDTDALVRANYYLNAMTLQYFLKDAQVVKYNGLEVVDLDGAVCQLVWDLNGESGSETTVSRNTEFDWWTPPAPARRRAEMVDAIAAGAAAPGGVGNRSNPYLPGTGGWPGGGS